jgi:hypothetical protein
VPWRRSSRSQSRPKRKRDGVSCTLISGQGSRFNFRVAALSANCAKSKLTELWDISILIPTARWEEAPPPGETNRLYIIDWEFAQFGHRSYDLGQIIGDFYERKVFHNSDVGLPTMEGVISGYGKLSDDMAYRTAIYVGVHLISWYTRMWRKNPKVALEKVTAGLTIGRDFILKGLEKDGVYFKRSALASVFTATENVL